LTLTREQKIARARELREQGWSYAAIARQLGVSESTPRTWCNPEWAKEQARKSNAKRGPAKRAWENEHDRGTCATCGEPTVASASRKNVRLCRDCWTEAEHREQTLRRERIAALWCEGQTLTEIAAALDSTPASIGVTLAHMREDGWDLPYRRAGNAARFSRVAA
jgi:transposase